MAKLSQRYKIPRAKIVNREDELLSMCSGEKVLHLGCADVPFTVSRGENLLHHRLRNVASTLIGVDSSIDGVRILREKGFSDVFCGNVEEFDFTAMEKCDIILAGEILEHCMNPGLFLSKVRTLMSKDTILLLTIPNAFSMKTFLFSILSYEKVHEDHNYWFSYRTIYQLLNKAGFKCREIYFYQGLSRDTLVSRLVDLTFSALPKISPCLADGLIVQAVIDDRRPDPTL